MTETIQLVEQHIIKLSDPRWAAIDHACWLSKNLWNYANYLKRQAFIFEDKSIPYSHLAHDLKTQVDFCALPRKVSQWVLKQLDKSWKSWGMAIRTWKDCPEQFTGRPKLPKYKHKTNGRNMLVYTRQALSTPLLRKGLVQPSGLGITIKTQQASETVQQVRIVPQKTHYVIEIIYNRPIKPTEVNPEWIAGVDIGLNNLATVASNQPGFVPFLVNGRSLKSINQYYNRRRAQLQSQLPEGRHTTQRLQRLTDKRNRKIKHELHVASRRIVDRLVDTQIGVLVIGKNKGWKQKIELGKRNNQHFVSLPHAQFIDILTYKAHLMGIKVIVTEESYTSKCSFLDREPIQKQEQYAGRRVKRGLFRAGNGKTINADVNGAYNIIRKVVPNAFAGNGIEGAVVHPSGATL